MRLLTLVLDNSDYRGSSEYKLARDFHEKFGHLSRETKIRHCSFSPKKTLGILPPDISHLDGGVVF